MTPPEIQTTFENFDFTNKPQQVEPLEPETKPQSASDKREEKKFVDTLMYGLSSPMVYAPGGWGDSFPKATVEMANILRLAHCSDCIDNELCTMYDAMLYMSTCSNVAPLQHSWYKIYMHSFREGNPTQWKILIKDDEWMERDADLNENELYDLKRLRSWIFKRQISYIKSKN